MSVGMQACCRLVRADVLSLYGILPFLWSFLLIYMICDLGGGETNRTALLAKQNLQAKKSVQ